MPISPRQQRVFNFIKGYTASNGYSPTIAEIQECFNYSSGATVHRILQILQNEGMIRRVKFARRIEIVKQAA
jgi:repressor LexA